MDHFLRQLKFKNHLYRTAELYLLTLKFLLYFTIIQIVCHNIYTYTTPVKEPLYVVVCSC